MAKSLLNSAGNFTTQSANITAYYTVAGANLSNATEANRQIRLREAGAITNLRIRLEGNSVTAVSTLRLRKNGANGNGIVSITASTSGMFEDVTGAVDLVTATDLVNYLITTGATGTSFNFGTISAVFEPTSTSVTRTRYGNVDPPNITLASSTRYTGLNEGSGSDQTVENQVQINFRKAGTLKHMLVNVIANARTTTTTHTLRKNGANGNLAVSITSGATGIIEDTSNSDTIASGDQINYSWTTGTGTQTLTVGIISCAFESSARDSMYVSTASSGTTISNNGTPVYGTLNGKAQFITNNRHETIVDFGGTLQGLGLLVTTNSSTSAGTISLNNNGSSSAISTSVAAGTTGIFEETATTDTFAAGGVLSYKFTPGTGGTTTVLRGAWVGFTVAADPTTRMQVRRFQKTTTATNGTTQDVAFDFDPKALLVISTGGTTDNTFADGWQYSQGVSDGTTQACTCSVSDDGETTSDTAAIHRNDAVLVKMSEEFTTTPTEVIRGSVAFGAAGTKKATFTWTVNNSEAIWITVIAWGGSDITNVKVNTVDTGRATAGTQDYTGLGFDCQDNKAALFLLDAGQNTANTIAAQACVGLGFATSPTQQHITSVTMEDAQGTSDTFRYISDSEIMNTIGGNAAVLQVAEFQSWITGGFRLNYTTKSIPATYKFSYLVIKGGTWFAGSAMSGTSTGNQDVPASVNSQPIRGVGTAMNGGTDATTGTQHARQGYGYTDGLNTSWLGGVDNDAAATIINAKRSSGNARLVGYPNTGAATASSTTMFADANFTSFGTDQFSINHQISPGSSVMFCYWVLADALSTTPVSATRTHKWNILSKATQSRTHVYSVIGKVVVTKTHKFHILEKTTTSKTHKWNILKLLDVDKTHKYDVIGKVVSTKTHKWHSEGQVSTTKTHKYDILSKVTTTKTHKWNIEHKIVTTKTHLWNTIGRLVVTKTHSYSILNRVDTTKTHKYSILQRVDTTKTHKWDILEKITVQKTHLWDIREKITKNTTHLYNVTGKVVSSFTHKYHVTGKVTTTKTHRYDVTGKVIATKTHKWNTIGKVVSNTTHKWHVIAKLTVSKTHKYDILERVDQNTTHKYNVEATLTQVTTTKTHKWHVESATEPVTTTKTHKWHIEQKIQADRTHIYDVIARVSTTKTHIYDVLAKVTVQKTHKWDTIGKVTKNTHHLYHVTGKVTKNTVHKWNSEGKVTKSTVHKWNIEQKVTSLRTHKWDILNTIATPALKTHKYSILSKVTASKTHKWSTLEKLTTSKTHKWDSGGKVVVTKTHRYDVGSGQITDYEFGGSTHALIKIPEREKVIDIISDLNNRALANIEIPVPNPPKVNIVQCQIIIEKYSKVLTAGYIPQSHATSGLILPGIIDRIDHRAVSGRLAQKIVEPHPQSRVRLLSTLQIRKLSSTNLHLQGSTQISETNSKKIKIAAETEVNNPDQIQKITALTANVAIPYNLGKQKAIVEEIMPKEKAKLLRAIRDMLKSDLLFGE